jgi:hypothetical protein
MKRENIDSIIELLQNNEIRDMSVNIYSFQKFCLCYVDTDLLDLNTNTMNFNTTPIAYVYGTGVYLKDNVPTDSFKYGIKNNNKISWSIPISFDISSEDLMKMMKLKNFW